MNVYENNGPLTPAPIPVTEAPQLPTPAPIVVVESPQPTDTATYLGCFEDSSQNRVMTNVTTDLELTNEVRKASLSINATVEVSLLVAVERVLWHVLLEGTRTAFVCVIGLVYSLKGCRERHGMGLFLYVRPA